MISHLRFAGFSNKWAGSIIEYLIDSFVRSGQKARLSLRNSKSGDGEPQGIMGKDPHTPTRFQPCPLKLQVPSRQLCPLAF
jgi:hypothetical protein